MNIGACGLRFEEFPTYLKRQVVFAKGINLESKFVPQTTYWLIVDRRPIGIGKLRHYLNESLLKSGGHIGYSVRPSDRGKGYGTLLLNKLLEQARDKGIRAVLLTCNEDNLPSRKVIESNRGQLELVVDGKCRYWVDLTGD